MNQFIFALINKTVLNNFKLILIILIIGISNIGLNAKVLKKELRINDRNAKINLLFEDNHIKVLGRYKSINFNCSYDSIININFNRLKLNQFIARNFTKSKITFNFVKYICFRDSLLYLSVSDNNTKLLIIINLNINKILVPDCIYSYPFTLYDFNSNKFINIFDKTSDFDDDMNLYFWYTLAEYQISNDTLVETKRKTFLEGEKMFNLIDKAKKGIDFINILNLWFGSYND
jgi:hypothetical protein